MGAPFTLLYFTGRRAPKGCRPFEGPRYFGVRWQAQRDTALATRGVYARHGPKRASPSNRVSQARRAIAVKRASRSKRRRRYRFAGALQKVAGHSSVCAGAGFRQPRLQGPTGGTDRGQVGRPPCWGIATRKDASQSRTGCGGRITATRLLPF